MSTFSFSTKGLLILSVAISLGSSIAFFPVDAVAAPAVATAHPAYTTTVFRVPAMTCADKACETAIYIAIHRLKGVKNIHINAMTKTVTVMYDPKSVNVPMLLHTLKNIGYPASVVHD